MNDQRTERLQSLLAAAEARIAELEASQAYDAGTDPVTGLPDVREICNRLEVERGRAMRHDRPLSIGLLDIDGFREINERHGDAVGDEVLASVGWVLSRFLRAYDLASRAAEDEFVIVLPETPLDGALKCFQRLLLELELLEVGPLPGISVSVGVTQAEPGQSIVQLFDATARGLQRARANGGGQTAVAFGSELADEFDEFERGLPPHHPLRDPDEA